MSTTHRSNFIGGTWVDVADGRLDDVVAPATGEVIAQVASSSDVDVDRAVEAAAAAAPVGPAPRPALARPR